MGILMDEVLAWFVSRGIPTSLMIGCFGDGEEDERSIVSVMEAINTVAWTGPASLFLALCVQGAE